MGKKNNQGDFKKRTKGSDKRKNTFNKYGKNTARGIRIKTAALEKQAIKKAAVKNSKDLKNMKQNNFPKKKRKA